MEIGLGVILDVVVSLSVGDRDGIGVKVDVDTGLRVVVRIVVCVEFNCLEA